MTIARRTLLSFALGVACCALPLTAAMAQALAQEQLASAPFTVLAPFPPGGAVDTLARILASGLTAQYRQPAVVENKSGANGNIGIVRARNAAPTGHTLLVVPQGNLTVNPTLMADPGYSVEDDFAPVASLARTANVIAVNPEVPVQTIAELVELSKIHPNTISYASPGVGSSLHLAGELFKQQSGADILHVPYKGTVPALNDAVGGVVPMIIGNLPALLPHVQSGKLRPLAVTDAERTPELPQVPTLAEAGVPGVSLSSWYGVMAPKATPAAVLEQLAADIKRIFSELATQEQLRRQGLEVWIAMGPDFGEVIRHETAAWAPIIKSRGLAAQ